MSTPDEIRTAKIANAFLAWVKTVPPTGGFCDPATVQERLDEADRLENDVLRPLLDEARQARETGR